MEANEPILPLLTIADLWKIFQQRLIPMAIAAMAAMTGLLMAGFVIPPEYQSTATLYILGQDNDFSLSLDVAGDCCYLLKSHSVLSKAAEELELDISWEALRETVTVTNPSGTRFLEVTVRADRPEKARHLANAICSAGAAQIERATGASRVQLYEPGVPEELPSNQITPLHYIIAACAGVGLVYCGAVVAFLLDDREKPGAKYLKLSDQRSERRSCK